MPGRAGGRRSVGRWAHPRRENGCAREHRRAWRRTRRGPSTGCAPGSRRAWSWAHPWPASGPAGASRRVWRWTHPWPATGRAGGSRRAEGWTRPCPASGRAGATPRWSTWMGGRPGNGSPGCARPASGRSPPSAGAMASTPAAGRRSPAGRGARTQVSMQRRRPSRASPPGARSGAGWARGPRGIAVLPPVAPSPARPRRPGSGSVPRLGWEGIRPAWRPSPAVATRPAGSTRPGPVGFHPGRGERSAQGPAPRRARGAGRLRAHRGAPGAPPAWASSWPMLGWSPSGLSGTPG